MLFAHSLFIWSLLLFTSCLHSLSIFAYSITITLVIVFTPSFNHNYCNSYDIQISYSLLRYCWYLSVFIFSETAIDFNLSIMNCIGLTMIVYLKCFNHSGEPQFFSRHWLTECLLFDKVSMILSCLTAQDKQWNWQERFLIMFVRFWLSCMLNKMKIIHPFCYSMPDKYHL